MTVEPTPNVGYSNRPYAYALVGVGSTFVIGAVIFLVVAALAGIIPALRASRIPPAVALAKTQELEPVADKPAPRDVSHPNPVTNARYTIQLAAFRSKLRADQAWGILQNRYLSILNGLNHQIQMADLGPDWFPSERPPAARTDPELP